MRKLLSLLPILSLLSLGLIVLISLLGVYVAIQQITFPYQLDLMENFFYRRFNDIRELRFMYDNFFPYGFLSYWLNIIIAYPFSDSISTLRIINFLIPFLLIIYALIGISQEAVKQKLIQPQHQYLLLAINFCFFFAYIIYVHWLVLYRADIYQLACIALLMRFSFNPNQYKWGIIFVLSLSVFIKQTMGLFWLFPIINIILNNDRGLYSRIILYTIGLTSLLMIFFFALLGNLFISYFVFGFQGERLLFEEGFRYIQGAPLLFVIMAFLFYWHIIIPNCSFKIEKKQKAFLFYWHIIIPNRKDYYNNLHLLQWIAVLMCLAHTFKEGGGTFSLQLALMSSLMMTSLLLINHWKTISGWIFLSMNLLLLHFHITNKESPHYVFSEYNLPSGYIKQFLATIDSLRNYNITHSQNNTQEERFHIKNASLIYTDSFIFLNAIRNKKIIQQALPPVVCFSTALDSYWEFDEGIINNPEEQVKRDLGDFYFNFALLTRHYYHEKGYLLVANRKPDIKRKIGSFTTGFCSFILARNEQVAKDIIPLIDKNIFKLSIQQR